jgi:hypothetical protein
MNTIAFIKKLEQYLMNPSWEGQREGVGKEIIVCAVHDDDINEKCNSSVE